MNLYFRMLLMLIRSLFHRGDADPLEPVVSRFHVMPNDLDFNFHMNNGRYLTIMDIGRFDFMVATGMLWPTLKRWWFPIVGSAQITYLRPLKPFRRFTITTQIECWDAKWFVILQSFHDKRGRICATARIRALLKSRRGIVPPREIFAVRSPVVPDSPAPSEATRLWLESLRAQPGVP